MVYKLLIVDDEALLRQGIMNMTDWHDHNIEIIGDAANGEEAIGLLHRNVPDILLTDIRMPGKNGIELIRYVKKHMPEIQVIVLSSFSDFEYVRESLTMGALDYILKPKMTAEDLLAVFERAKKNISEDRIFLSKKETVDDYSPAIKSLLWDYDTVDNMLETLDFAQLLYYVHSFLTQGGIEAKEGIRLCIDLYYHIIFKIEELRIVEASIKQKRYAFVKKIQSSESMNELYDTFVSVVGEIEKNLRFHRYSDLINKVQEYIRSHYDEELSLKTIADHFYISKGYLCNKYKKETRQNVKDYICEVRMEKAKEILRVEALNIQEAAKKVGFDNPNYFSYVFKKNVGMTPMQYVSLFKKE